MALNPSGAISLGGPTTGQSIAVELGLSPTASISLNKTEVRTLAQVPSGAITMPGDFWGKSSAGTQKAIFGFGNVPVPAPLTKTNTINLVSNTGVVASDTPGTGTARSGLAASGYGGDKAIFGFGTGVSPAPVTNVTNLVSNTGVVASDTPGVGTARQALAAAAYGGDKAIFGFGFRSAPAPVTNITNLVSNAGVVASDTPGVGSAREGTSCAGYDKDKAIFAFGRLGVPTFAFTSNTNLVSNTGVVASDTTNVGVPARGFLAAAVYGGDKAIMGNAASSNLISNTGVLASDTPSAGTARTGLAAAGYSSTP
jgi:hypothetical protein